MSKEIDMIFEEIESGKLSVFEANERLHAAGAGYYLDPWKNVIHRNEPENIWNGVGLMDTGTGTKEKVELVNCKLVTPAFDPAAYGSEKPCVIVECAGKVYYIAEDGVSLTAEKPAEEKQTVKRTPDLSRRLDLAGQTVRQNTAAGKFDVTYNADGMAVKSVRAE